MVNGTALYAIYEIPTTVVFERNTQQLEESNLII
jgi:hypothetical protein